MAHQISPTTQTLQDHNGVANDRPRRSATMQHKGLEASQKYFGYGAILIPTLVTGVAIALLPFASLHWTAILSCLSLYIFTTLGITVGYHRFFSHASFKTYPLIQVMLVIFGSMAAQGHMMHWVCNHRRHHQYTDQSGDPHSPHITIKGKTLRPFNGFFYAHMGWLLEGEFPNVLYAKDLLKNPLLVQVNRLYLLWVLLGFVIPAVFGGCVTGSWLGVWQGMLWGGFVRIFLVHHAIWSINSINHLYGNRPFKTSEKSTNNLWVALINLGEGWHNNHHAFPNSAVHGFSRWQIDMSAWLIRTLEFLSLAWDIKTPTPEMLKMKRV